MSTNSNDSTHTCVSLKWYRPNTLEDCELFNSIMSVADETIICWPQDWVTIASEEEWSIEEKTDYKKFVSSCNQNMINHLKEMVEKLEVIQKTIS